MAFLPGLLRASGAPASSLVLLLLGFPAAAEVSVSVSAGLRHTCAVGSSGGVKCWGANFYGELGDNSTTPSTSPVDVVGLASGIKAVAAGDDHTCALTTAGGVKCWGRNTSGQLGNSSFTPSLVPVDVTGLASGIVAISAGLSFNCALTSAGGVKCWGYGGAGQMGNDSVANQSAPIDVPGMTSGVAVLTTGRYHACVVTTAGGAKCWGWNFYGQLGDGTATQRNTPVDVTGLASGVASIASRYDHTCALTTGRGAKCWGYNGSGQLGNGMPTISLVATPVDVVGLGRGVAAILPGQLHTCALTTRGGVKCWGYGFDGQLGNGTLSQFSTPVDVPGLASATARVVVGAAHVFAQVADAGWKAWGKNLNGQLGDTTNSDRDAPVDIAAISGGNGAAYPVILESGQETPLNASPAVGSGAAVVDTDANTIALDLAYGGLPTAVVGAHLHGPGARGVPVGVKIGIPTTSPLGHAVTYDEADEADILAGLWYVNIHTTDFPGGEIRGQLDGTGAAPPVARRADFDGNLKSDLPWSHADGRAAIWLMNGTSPTGAGEIIGAGTGWQVAHLADFDGDGKSDLLWSHADGRLAIYLMDGMAPVATKQVQGAGTGWSAVRTADLDGDGKADILAQHDDGRTAAWLMDGTTVATTAPLLGAATGWAVTGSGDFDADGKADLLWTHADGGVAVWLMDGATLAGSAQVLGAATGWSVSHVADFDGDGRSDLAWQHGDGSAALWLMDGAMLSAGAGILGPGTGWTVTRTGDFDRDGKADLLFAHADGRAAIYLMDGLVPAATTQILNAGGGWSAVRVQDLDADGKSDIVWENADGSVAVWLMNGDAMAFGQGILGPGSGWSVNGASQ